MWFKNLRIYQLLKPFALSEEELQIQLAEREFRSCGSMEPATLGWTSPLGRRSERLAHEVNGSIMLCLRQEEKVLPASVVREMVEEKAILIEEAEARQVSRREKGEIREEIIQDLMPRAFTKSARTYAMIDRTSGWILLDAASANKAEALLGLLRETLGTLPVRPLDVAVAPPSVMTEWVRRPEQYGDFVLQDSCELQDASDEKAIVRCKGHDLGAQEVLNHLDAGKQVVKLAVEWNERLSCMIESDLALKRIKFLDIIQEEAADSVAEDDIARFDVDFSLMALEFRRFLPRLLELFGGVQEEN
ncbi:MAG: recombination-associated protein RdgC [gamma proteobacterium endosymbiont of Lamellibrachia anaximandri]|nr:recombination-associated protein RdgC [gamma proteobacterium endosymbiont of Lamellibrachia anaximandri]